MAGTLKTNVIQLGDSATATENFVIKTNVDGSATIARGNDGSTTQDIVTITASGVLVNERKSSVTTLTGSTVDLADVPANVTKIRIVVSQMSLDATAKPIIQIGTSGTPEVSGYSSTSGQFASSSSAASLTTGIGLLATTVAASTIFNGIAELILSDAATNTWIINWMGMADNTMVQGSGTISLSGLLNIIRFTSVGAQNYDGGSVLAYYEG